MEDEGGGLKAGGLKAGDLKNKAGTHVQMRFRNRQEILILGSGAALAAAKEPVSLIPAIQP